MSTGTRSRTRRDGSKANPPASSTKDVAPPPPKQTLASAEEKLPTTKGAISRRDIKNVDPHPQNAGNVSAKIKKRKFDDSGESDEETGTYPTNTTPSRGHKTNIVASPTGKNSNKPTLEAIPQRDIKKIHFAGLEDMASKDFTEILADRGIDVLKAEMQGFSDLKVNRSEHQTAVCWKTITGSKPSSAKLPDTATFGECSVFAVEATTKERFEEKAKRFLGDNMGLKALKRSMALVLHYDRDGKLQSAIVGYPLGLDLYYYDSLEAETANNIAIELNRGKGPERWNLEVLREGRSKKKKLAKYESDTSSD